MTALLILAALTLAYAVEQRRLRGAADREADRLRGQVYRLDLPLTSEWDDRSNPVEYVWVSAVNVPFSGPETYIFPCNETGKVLSWSELKGSFRGGLDHEEALRGAGYEVAR